MWFGYLSMWVSYLLCGITLISVYISLWSLSTWIGLPDRGSSSSKKFLPFLEWKVKNESESCSVISNSLQPHELYSPWNSPDQNAGVGSLSLLQVIFPIQRLKPGLLHCRWILYQLSYQGIIKYNIAKNIFKIPSSILKWLHRNSLFFFF